MVNVWGDRCSHNLKITQFIYVLKHHAAPHKYMQLLCFLWVKNQFNVKKNAKNSLETKIYKLT
jgi:hypothetical protein